MLRNCLLIDFARISLSAGFKKSAGLAGCLLRSVLKVLANVSSERQCQIVQLDEVARRGAKFEKRLSKGEFVRRDIPAEQYQCAPVVLNRGLNFEKLHHH